MPPIETFAAGIAHDINNELMLIINYLSTRNVEEARLAIDRCSALTTTLLSQCRRDPVSLQPLDVEPFLKEFLATVGLPARVKLIVEIAASLPPISADARALARVLRDLIHNACAAMDNNGTLRLTASRQTIELENSAPVNGPRSSPRTFDPFYTTRGEYGTGPGSAVNDIMKQHSGSFTTTAKTEPGSRFTLRFLAA